MFDLVQSHSEGLFITIKNPGKRFVLEEAIVSGSESKKFVYFTIDFFQRNDPYLY